MKQLHEYETPESDELEQLLPLTGYHEMKIARNLERRLAACRDALQKATDECLWRSDSELPLSAEKSQELYDLAVETLALTEPK